MITHPSLQTAEMLQYGITACLQTVLNAALLMAIKEQVYGSTRRTLNLLAAAK
jgi:hypothetical protein